MVHPAIRSAFGDFGALNFEVSLGFGAWNLDVSKSVC
jgi:hypothetical protein